MGLLDGWMGQLVQQAAEKMLRPEAGHPPAAGSGVSPLPQAPAGSVLGQVLTEVLGGGGGRAAPLPRQATGHSGLGLMLLPFLLAWIQRQGGLGAVLGHLGRSGLQAQASSWVRPGPNLPLTDQAVQQLFGAEVLQQLAQAQGLASAEVTQGIATLLPELVDRLTPEGHQAEHADQTVQDLLHSVQQWSAR